MVMDNNHVLKIILDSPELPTIPIVASKLLVLTGREDTSLSDIADLISQDIALATKILKVSNSAFYNFPQQISSISQAVSILGINAVRSLVLSFSFLSMRGKKGGKFNIEQFWEHSLAGAVAAHLILEQVPNTYAEEIFLVSLLRDMGKLILACTLPEQYEKVLETLQADKEDELILEERIIGADHCFIGSKVAEQWGFPERLFLPILYHRNPDQYTGPDGIITQAVHATYLADLIVKILYSDTPEEYHKKFRQEAKRLLHLKVVAVNKILSNIHNMVDQTANALGLKIKPTKSVEEILQEANLRLNLLNLSYEEMNRELVHSKLALEKLTKELEKKNKLLENLANIDGLTEVYNHRYFQNFLDKEINRSTRNGQTLSILLADIDHFKNFNDTYGHQTGDFILKELCHISSQNIREYDLLARYGGEEFIFLLPETSAENACNVAEKLRKLVADYDFDDGDNKYRVTISIGVASASPSGTDFKKNEFIGLADEALYEAKHKGRNRVALYKPKKKQWLS